MKIRKAGSKDAKICGKMRSIEERRWSAIDFVNSVREKNAIFLVAEQNRNIMGYCIGYLAPTQKKEAMLHETRVIKEERGAGVGTALVEAFCKEAFRRGAKAVYAMIERKHIRFYCGACGFKKNNKWIELKKSC